MNIDEKKINQFFAGLTEAERILVSHQVSLSDGIRDFIRRNKIDADEFIKRFHLKNIGEYERFINGAMGYHIQHIAILNAWGVELAQKGAKDNVIFSIDFIDYEHAKTKNNEK